MKPTFLALCLLLVAVDARATTPAAETAAAPASAAASAPLHATRAASALCAPRAASRSMRSHVVMSQVRRTPGEPDPCAGPASAAPPPPPPRR